MEILISILVGLAIMECYAWTDSFSKWLLERAVRQIEDSDRERCREEWTADLEAMPNTMFKLIFAVQSFRASTVKSMNANITKPDWEEIEIALAQVLEVYPRFAQRFDEMKLSFEHVCRLEEELEQSIAKDLSSLKLKKWSDEEWNQKARSLAIAINRFENLCGLRIGETDINTVQTKHATDPLRVKLKKIEGLFDAALTKIEHIKDFVERGRILPEDVHMVDAYNAEVREINRLMETDEELEPVRERLKMLAELYKTVEKMN
jgi:hypothetical protein